MAIIKIKLGRRSVTIGMKHNTPDPSENTQNCRINTETKAAEPKDILDAIIDAAPEWKDGIISMMKIGWLPHTGGDLPPGMKSMVFRDRVFRTMTNEERDYYANYRRS